MERTSKTTIETISVDDAVELLQRTHKDGQTISHVVSVVRDPNDTSRILAINAVENG